MDRLESKNLKHFFKKEFNLPKNDCVNNVTLLSARVKDICFTIFNLIRRRWQLALPFSIIAIYLLYDVIEWNQTAKQTIYKQRTSNFLVEKIVFEQFFLKKRRNIVVSLNLNIRISIISIGTFS